MYFFSRKCRGEFSLAVCDYLEVQYSMCSMKNQLSTNLKVCYDNFNSHWSGASIPVWLKPIIPVKLWACQHLFLIIKMSGLEDPVRLFWHHIWNCSAFLTLLWKFHHTLSSYHIYITFSRCGLAMSSGERDSLNSGFPYLLLCASECYNISAIAGQKFHTRGKMPCKDSWMMSEHKYETRKPDNLYLVLPMVNCNQNRISLHHQRSQYVHVYCVDTRHLSLEFPIIVTKTYSGISYCLHIVLSHAQLWKSWILKTTVDPKGSEQMFP